MARMIGRPILVKNNQKYKIMKWGKLHLTCNEFSDYDGKSNFVLRWS